MNFDLRGSSSSKNKVKKIYEDDKKFSIVRKFVYENL